MKKLLLLIPVLFTVLFTSINAQKVQFTKAFQCNLINDTLKCDSVDYVEVFDWAGNSRLLPLDMWLKTLNENSNQPNIKSMNYIVIYSYVNQNSEIEEKWMTYTDQQNMLDNINRLYRTLKDFTIKFATGYNPDDKVGFRKIENPVFLEIDPEA